MYRVDMADSVDIHAFNVKKRHSLLITKGSKRLGSKSLKG